MTATPVSPLPVTAMSSCPVCGKSATWQVGPDTRSCTDHLGSVLASLYETNPHPFAPYLPRPLFRGHW